MKKLLSLVILVALLGMALWWFSLQTDEPSIPAKIAQPSLSLSPKPASMVAPPAFAPKSAPAVSSVFQSQSVMAGQQDSAGIEQIQLKETISHAIGLIEAGDNAGYYIQKLMLPHRMEQLYQLQVKMDTEMNQTLAQQGLPAESTQSFADFENSNRKTIQELSTTAKFADALPATLAALKSIENATPKFNDTGDEAEYTLDPAISANLPNKKKTIIFHREDGQWYEGPKP